MILQNKSLKEILVLEFAYVVLWKKNNTEKTFFHIGREVIELMVLSKIFLFSELIIFDLIDFFQFNFLTTFLAIALTDLGNQLFIVLLLGEISDEFVNLMIWWTLIHVWATVVGVYIHTTTTTFRKIKIYLSFLLLMN